MYYYHCKRWLHLYNWWKSLTHFLRNGIFHEVKISERCVANLAWFLWLQIRSLSASRYWSLPALCSRNVQRPNPSPAEQNRTEQNISCDPAAHWALHSTPSECWFAACSFMCTAGCDIPISAPASVLEDPPGIFSGSPEGLSGCTAPASHPIAGDPCKIRSDSAGVPASLW